MAWISCLTIFTIHFTWCLIFIRVWLIEDLLFEIGHLGKLHKLCDKSTYIHDKQSAQISRKHDGYNTYLIIVNNVPSWLCGLKKLKGHKYLKITSTSTSTPHKAPNSRRRKLNIRRICSHCLVITKVALWQLKHLGTWFMWCTVNCFIVYKNVLTKFSYMCICRGYFRNWRQNLAIIQCYWQLLFYCYLNLRIKRASWRD